jgi:hypothetical protein
MQQTIHTSDKEIQLMQQQPFWYLLALLLLILGLLPAHVSAQDSGVVPASGRPGDTFRFFASGFWPGEPVNYWVSTPGDSVLGNVEYEVRASNAGRAAWEWRVPRSGQAGYWLMVGRGRNSGIERPIAFEVLPGGEPPDESKVIDVIPKVGAPGTRFEFVARDFDGEERIGYWLNAPDGRIVSSRAYRTDADDGDAAWSWRAPDDALRGRWQMVARGKDSNIERVIVFEVR